MNRQQAKGLAWLALALALGFLAAGGLPYFAARVPWSFEKSLGAVLGPELPAPICGAGRPQALAALRALTARLYPAYPDDSSFPLTVEVVDKDEVNAVAGLGGRVYAFDGLLREARSPEEVAGVLAHEIEHVRRRHVMRGAAARLLTLGALKLAFSGGAPLARALLNMRFTREQEGEADEGGLRRLRDAGVDSAGYADFFERLSGKGFVPELISDHPASSSRAELARSNSGGKSRPIMSGEDWKALRTICSR